MLAAQRIQQLPPYPFKEVEDAVEKLRAQGVTPIDFGVGDPCEPTPDFVRETLRKAADSCATTGYPSYAGSREFRQAVWRYMKRRFNLDLDPDTEICSNIGSKEAVFNFAFGFVNPGDLVIVPSPGYPPMKNGTLFAGGEVYFTPLLPENDFLIDYESIPKDIARRAKIIWCNYPNNPTGAVATREFYEGLLAWARKNDIVIASDEGAYIDIYYGEKPLSILEVARDMSGDGARHKGIVAFYSLSKRNNMTGYRIGFVCGDRGLMDVYKKLKTNIDSGAPSVIQAAAIAALDNDDHAAAMRVHYSEKAKLLYEMLENIGLPVRPSPATFFVWQRVPADPANPDDPTPDITFAKKLLDPEIAIVVTPGSLISDPCDCGLERAPKNLSSLQPHTPANRQSHKPKNPGAGYVRFALMPTLPEFRQASSRLKKLTP